jgi:hypothetical protein
MKNLFDCVLPYTKGVLLILYVFWATLGFSQNGVSTKEDLTSDIDNTEWVETLTVLVDSDDVPKDLESGGSDMAAADLLSSGEEEQDLDFDCSWYQHVAYITEVQKMEYQQKEALISRVRDIFLPPPRG